MNKILIGFITTLIILVIGCQKKEFKVELEKENVYLIVGDTVNIKITSYISEAVYTILNDDTKFSDVEIIDGEIVIKGKSIGKEEIKIYEEFSKEEKDLTINVISELIYLDEMFSKCDDDYLIYFYNDDCTACYETTDYIFKYLEQNNHQKIYFCNLKQGTDENKIYRVYNNDDGEGIDKKSFVSGTMDVNDIYIGNIPALTKVSLGELKFLADGKTNVKNYIEEFK